MTLPSAATTGGNGAKRTGRIFHRDAQIFLVYARTRDWRTDAVAPEALRGDRTLQEIASQYQVHPNQVGAWKRQAVDGQAEVFSKGAERRSRDHESEIRDLHAKIGELIVERDTLSRGSGR